MFDAILIQIPKFLKNLTQRNYVGQFTWKDKCTNRVVAFQGREEHGGFALADIKIHYELPQRNREEWRKDRPLSGKEENARERACVIEEIMNVTFKSAGRD